MIETRQFISSDTVQIKVTFEIPCDRWKAIQQMKEFKKLRKKFLKAERCLISK